MKASHTSAIGFVDHLSVQRIVNINVALLCVTYSENRINFGKFIAFVLVICYNCHD